MSKKPDLRRVAFILVICLVLVAAVYLFLHSRGYFRRRYIRQIQGYIVSFGPWSPLVVIFLFFLTTAIPPLPLPMPLLELATGLIFGFWEGLIIVWFSQISSSIFAFYIAKFFRKNRFLDKHRHLLDNHRPRTILLTRLTMSAPFNFISFLAGLTKMDLASFTAATAIGTLPESLIFSFVGSLLAGPRFSLWGVVSVVFTISLAGFVFSLTVWGDKIFSS